MWQDSSYIYEGQIQPQSYIHLFDVQLEYLPKTKEGILLHTLLAALL